jgi:hypothetical protein
VRGATAQPWYKYQVTSEQRDQPGLRVRPLRRVKFLKGSASFTETLPAMSLTVFSTFKLKADDRGIIAE